MLLAADSKWATLLPDVVDKTAHAPRVMLNYVDIQAMAIPGMIIDMDMLDGGVHFAAKLTRLAQLTKDLDEDGFDWTPIPGPAAIAMTVAAERVFAGITALPAEKRRLAFADVLYSTTDYADAGTDSWYDYMTPRTLMAGDGGATCLAQFCSMMPGAFNGEADGGRESGEFQSRLTQMAGSVGRDISAMEHDAQAAAVAGWCKQTRPPRELQLYVEDAALEIDRRAGATVAERYMPLFAVGWRHAYPLLRQLWPGEVHDPVTATAALATSLGVIGVGHGLSPQVVVALLSTLEDYISFAERDTNSQRSSESTEVRLQYK